MKRLIYTIVIDPITTQLCVSCAYNLNSAKAIEKYSRIDLHRAASSLMSWRPEMPGKHR